MKDLGIDIDAFRIEPDRLGGLIALIGEGTVSGSVGKEIFEKMYGSGQTAEQIVDAEGLIQIHDETVLSEAVRAVLAANPDPVAQYRAGRTAALGFLVGQVMKATGGKANPRKVNELLRDELDRSR